MDYKRELAKAEKVISNFLSGAVYNFSELKPSTIPDKLPGVYAIFNSKEALYVGRSKNLRRRLYGNHLMGPLANARLKKYLIKDSDFPNINDINEAKDYIRKNCSLRFVPIDTVIERGKIEGLLSFALNVKYMCEEH